MKKYVLSTVLVLCLSVSGLLTAGGLAVTAGSLLADVNLLSPGEQTAIGVDPFLLLGYEWEKDGFSGSLSSQLQFAHAYALKPSQLSRFDFDPIIVIGSFERWGVISLEDLGISASKSEFLWQVRTGYIGLRPMLYADTSDLILDLDIGWGVREMDSFTMHESAGLPDCSEGYDLFIGINPDMNITYDLSFTDLLLGVSASAAYGRRISGNSWMHSSLGAEIPVFRDLLGEFEISPDLIVSADAMVYRLLSEKLYLQGIGDLVIHNIFDGAVLQYTAAAQLHYLPGRGNVFASLGVTGLIDGVESLDVKFGGTWEFL